MNNLARAHLHNNSMQIAKPLPMRNKSAPVDFFLVQNTEDLRDIFVRLTLAAFRTGERAAEVEGECVDTDALIARHNAE